MGHAIALQASAASLMEQFEAGTLLVQLNQSDLDRRIGAMGASVNAGVRMIVISVLVVGLLLASTLVLMLPLSSIAGEGERSLVRMAAEAGFVIGAFLSVTLLLNTLWRSFRRKT